MQRAPQRVDAAGNRGEQVGLRRADQPHRRRRAVLFVVGVQDEEHVQGPDGFGVHLVGFGGEPERHPQEVLHQRERVVRVEERLTDRLLVRVGRDRRQLGQQPDGGEFHLGVVERVERVLVVGRQRVGRAGQHRHRMRITREAVEEPLQVLVQQRVALDLVGELLQLLLVRQFPVDQQIADLDEVRLLGKLLDRVAAIAQDAGVAVDVGDGALGGRGVDESAVEGGVAGLGQQRTQRDTVGALGRVDDVQVKLTTGVFEGGVLVVIGHGNPFFAAAVRTLSFKR